jgi:hypothetical protein
MITLTGVVQLMDGNDQPYIDITHKSNNYWNDVLKESDSVFEFYFELDKKEYFYNFVGCKKITKAKARKNKK